MMNLCPFEAVGYISPIMCNSHVEKGHGEEIKCSSVGGKMNDISINLAFVALSYEFDVVFHHRHLE